MTETMFHKVSNLERNVLRRLAQQVAEIAALPIQAERIKLWKDFNSLKPKRPMILAYPEGGWRDLIPESGLLCQNPLLRGWEMILRQQIYHFNNIFDDQPVTNYFNVGLSANFGDYGIKQAVKRTAEIGSYSWDAVVKGREDVDKLCFRSISIDRTETFRHLQLAKDILGDILYVRKHGSLWWSCGLTSTLIMLRGLEQIMIDMYENQQLLHKLMSLLRDDTINMLDMFEKEGVLSLNNGEDDFVGSAGVGATDELPASDFKGHVRTRDMWVLGEAQEFTGVGPAQFYEFALQYQIPILNRFGLICYGCCETLDKKFDLLIKHLPKLRRVSVSPWCDRMIAAEKLSNNYIYSWKPNPAMICGPSVDYDFFEKDISETLRIAKGCCVEIIMKDTHTFNGDIERISKWSKIASRIVRDG